MKDFEIIKLHIEIEIDFFTSWYILYPEGNENFKRRINTILGEYMYFITPFI